MQMQMDNTFTTANTGALVSSTPSLTEKLVMRTQAALHVFYGIEKLDKGKEPSYSEMKSTSCSSNDDE